MRVRGALADNPWVYLGRLGDYCFLPLGFIRWGMRLFAPGVYSLGRADKAYACVQIIHSVRSLGARNKLQAHTYTQTIKRQTYPSLGPERVWIIRECERAPSYLTLP